MERKRRRSKRKVSTGKRRKTSSKSVRTLATYGKRDKMVGNDTLNYYSKLRNACPLPNRWITKTSCANQGYYPSATGIGGYWQVSMNCPMFPFGTTAIGSGTTLPTPSTAIATLNSLGFAYICNNHMYNSYRVLASEITVRMVPTNLTDPIAVVIYPAPQGAYQNYSTADNMPHGKNWLCTTEKGSTTMKNSISTAKVFGVSPQCVKDDISNEFSAQVGFVPSRGANWYVAFTDLTQANIAAKLVFDVKVEFVVEFFELNYSNLTQT